MNYPALPFALLRIRIVAQRENRGYQAADTVLCAYGAGNEKIGATGTQGVFERRVDCHRGCLCRAVFKHRLLRHRRKNLQSRREEYLIPPFAVRAYSGPFHPHAVDRLSQIFHKAPPHRLPSSEFADHLFHESVRRHHRLQDDRKCF